MDNPPFHSNSANVHLIGIAGGTCSGKSAVSEALCDLLAPRRCSVVPMDCYYYTPNPELVTTGRANFDHPAALDIPLLSSHMRTLAQGLSVDLPVYDRRIHSRTGWRVLPAADVIILEGLFALMSMDLQLDFSLRVYLDAPADLRLIRRLHRDIEEYELMWRDVCDEYLKITGPMHTRFVEPTRACADLVIETAGIHDSAAKIATALSATAHRSK